MLSNQTTGDIQTNEHKDCVFVLDLVAMRKQWLCIETLGLWRQVRISN